MANVITRNEEEDVIEVDLARLIAETFHNCIRYWWVIAACFVIGIVGLFGIYQITYTPMYRSSATFTVTAGDDGSSYYYSESTADQLSKTFPYMLESRYFQNVLLDTMGRDSINGTLEASTLEDSNMVTMTMTSDNAQDAYDFLQAAIDVYPETAHFVLGNISFYMIEEPSLPDHPYNQLSLARRLLYGGGGGILAALVILALMALFNKRVSSADDLKADTNMKCLAYTPAIKETAGGAAHKKNLLVDNARIAKPYQESISTLSMRIRRDMKKADMKTLMVTSTTEGEGKTVTAVNLALSLAAHGKRVLLIDANLRNPAERSAAALLGVSPIDGIGKICNSSNQNGSMKMDVFTQTNRENLLLLSGKNSTKTPSSVLGSQELRHWLTAARQVFDYIVIDTPAAAKYQDALLMTDVADALLYVIRYDKVALNDIKNGLRLLEGGSAKMLGYTFNYSPESMGDYGYGRYGYGYGRYGYGYGYKGKYGYGGYGSYGYSSKSEDDGEDK